MTDSGCQPSSFLTEKTSLLLDNFILFVTVLCYFDKFKKLFCVRDLIKINKLFSLFQVNIIHFQKRKAYVRLWTTGSSVRKSYPSPYNVMQITKILSLHFTRDGYCFQTRRWKIRGKNLICILHTIWEWFR